MFSSALIIPTVIQWLQQAQHEIFIVSAFVAGMIALIMLFPRSESLAVEKWTKYFGAAFFVISAQYSVTLLIRAFISSWRNSYPLDLSLSLASGLNSILFLMAALSLLGHMRLRRLLRIAIAFAVVSSFCISFDQLVEAEWSWLLRIPDALISSFCLGAVGYAIALNIGSRHQRHLAIFALCWAIIGTLIRLMYGLNPLIAELNQIQQSLGAIRQTEALAALDSLAFACALPLKFALFIPVFWLLNSISRTSDQLKRILIQQSETRISYLSTSGIVRQIADAIRADTVEIAIRLAGNEQQVALIAYQSGIEKDEYTRIVTIETNSMLQEVLLKGSVIKQGHKSSKATIISVPIIHNGGVIGCLRVERKTNTTFNEVVTRQIKDIALLLSPSVQSFRELASLDQASNRFAKLAIDPEIGSSKDIAKATANSLHDILEPVATGLSLEIGFHEQHVLLGEKSEQVQIIGQEINGFDIKSKSELVPKHLGELEFYKSQLIATIGQEQQISSGTTEEGKREGYSTKALSYCPLGKLLLAVPANRDKLNQPTLGAHYLYRKAICTVATDALLDWARNYLNARLNEFNVETGREDVTVTKWFEAIKRTALESELLWAVTTNPSFNEDESEMFMGDASWVDVVRQLSPIHQEEFSRNAISCIPLSSPVDGTTHVICLSLSQAQAHLWLGVARAGFGIELNFESPWKVFLKEFGRLADAALTRILTTQKFRKMQIEASQNQALATIAATTGTLIHQLVNMARDQMSGTASLHSALINKRITIEDERYLRLLESMKDSGQRMLELTRSFTNFTRVDDRRPCKLLDAVQHARDLLSTSLAQYNIQVECSIDSNLMVDVPFYVAALAFANLISNAKDAIKLNSKLEDTKPYIRVTAEITEKSVVCHIIDSGGGIPAEIRVNIFQLGFSTKSNSGGWGLYLVKRSLLENGCNIQLTNPGPPTTFTLHFPHFKDNEH